MRGSIPEKMPEKMRKMRRKMKTPRVVETRGAK
jgi:hypothetical protein